MIELIGLFAVSFFAATLLPGGSEAALLAMVASTDHSIWLLFGVASLGNTLGSVLNYALGRGALRYQNRKWFPASPATLAKAQSAFLRWGQWAVLLAWVPVIGDPITVVAGVMRMGFIRFLILVAISKTLRYAVLLGLFSLIF